MQTDKTKFLATKLKTPKRFYRDYFGEFDDYRIVTSKDMSFRLKNNGIVPFLQIGEIKPKYLNIMNTTNITKIIKVR